MTANCKKKSSAPLEDEIGLAAKETDHQMLWPQEMQHGQAQNKKACDQ